MHIHVNGIDLHYAVVGDGEPLVWLHGFMGCGSDWKYLWPEPPAGFRLIAPDLRCQGASVDLNSSFTFRQAARDVLDLLRNLHLERANVIGLSGGGITALHMATLEPRTVVRMVLVSAPPYFPEQARAIQRLYSWDMLPDLEKQRMRERHQGGQSQIDQLLSISRAFAEDHTDVNFTPDLLKKISAETLLVFGDRDPFYPVSLAVELHAAIPKSYLWVVPNGGHGPIFREHAHRFNETAFAFLSGKWKAV